TTGPQVFRPDSRTNLTVLRKEVRMNASNLRALLGALALCTTVVGVAAAPQYAVVDLGSTTVAGAGLPWQARDILPSPANWPTGCSGVAANHVYAQYGNIAVGSINCGGDIGQEAAKWTIALNGSATLTELGWLPGSVGDVMGPYSVAYDFNNVGDIVGQ